MLCVDKCPKATKCRPLANIVSEDNETFVCVGLHNEQKKDNKQDIFRHCFKSETTDSMFDYDDYDLKSVISVMADALLINEIENENG